MIEREREKKRGERKINQTTGDWRLQLRHTGVVAYRNQNLLLLLLVVVCLM